MEEKKARRNKRIVVISAMLVLLIAILCFGGATFAKYVTSKNAKVEQATVAKWGFVVTANADDLFHNAYKDGATNAADNNTKATWTSTTANKTGIKVMADTEANKVVAPGTKGSMTISVSGTAEVAANFSFTVDTSKTKDVYLKSSDSDPLGAIDYKPVKWTLKKGTTADNATAIDATVTNTTLATCLAKLDTEFADKVYAPNETISTSVYVLEWEWAFTKTADNDSNDAYDTILGQIAAAQDADKATVAQGCEYSTTIAFDFTISIEQSATGTVA